jgi:exodeoxyribonuclease VII large subunit
MIKQNAILNHFKNVLVGQSEKMIFRQHERIHFCENTARLINPENVLKRGYTITKKDGKIIKSANQLNVNEEIETRFADGNVKSRII